MQKGVPILVAAVAFGLLASSHSAAQARRTVKPVLHGRHWVAITGKPLAATAGALTYAKGGNAADAAAAMLAAACTMWDTLGWGGETQALVYDPRTKKVTGLNALGVAPSGATPEYYKGKGHRYPPEFGPLAAVTPGTPGGLITLLQEWGRLSLKEVLAPAIQMADGYPIEAQLANALERERQRLSGWPYSKAIFLPHAGAAREAPVAGELFVQKDLAATLRKLVEAEQQALAAGKSRREALQAAYDRFYKGDIADELVRGTQEQGGLFTRDDLARWSPKLEEPVKTSYRGIDVYKLTVWTQGPAMLQALNILENADLKAMGYNSPRYIHTLYQAMSLAFADRDFYYGDPAFPPEEPVAGLLSKEYARQRYALMNDGPQRPGRAPRRPLSLPGAGREPLQGGARRLAQRARKGYGHSRAGPRRRDELRRGLPRRHHLGDRGGRGGLRGVGHPERRVEPRARRGPHRDRPQPARAELRDRGERRPVQRDRARQAPARHAHADAVDEGRPAAARLRRAGRRHPGPEPAAVLPERGRVRDERAAGGGGART